MVSTWRGCKRENCRIPGTGAPDFSRQVLRSAWGQTESKIRFGSGPGRPKFSDGSAAFFDSIFNLEPGHRPKPSNRTEIGLLNLSTDSPCISPVRSITDGFVIGCGHAAPPLVCTWLVVSSSTISWHSTSGSRPDNRCLYVWTSSSCAVAELLKTPRKIVGDVKFTAQKKKER